MIRMGEPSWNLLSPPSPRLDSSSCSLMLGTDTEGELQWGLSPVPGLPRGAAPRALAPQSWLGTHSTRPWHMEPVVLPGRARPPQNPQGAPGSTSTPPKCLCHAEGRRTVNHGTGWTPSSLLSTADHSPLVLNPSPDSPRVKGMLSTSLDQSQCKADWMLPSEWEIQGPSQRAGGQH